MKFVLLLFAGRIKAWVYLHNPPGSNNRLNEGSAINSNTNRLFDSQNNRRGGYNVPDAKSYPANSEDEQFKYSYFRYSFEIF